MQEQEIINLLWQYGHFRNPAYKLGPSAEIDEAAIKSGNLRLSDPEVREAMRSYQHLQKPVLDELTTLIHGRRAIVDGDFGPATEQLLLMPRCGAPDYVQAEELLGTGRWGACKVDLYPSNNAITVSWDLSRCPPHVKPLFEQIWTRTVEAYAEVGLALIRTDGDPKANLTLSFTIPQQESGNLRGNWIGLAIVGWSGIRCSDSIWGLFDLNYNPANTLSEWTSLVKHEIGHNVGLQHSSGGVMNPSIVRGLPVSWKGDPSWSTLAKWYGGEPVVPKNPGPGPGPGPVPTPPGGGAIPDLEVIYKGRAYTCFPKAQL